MKLKSRWIVFAGCWLLGAVGVFGAAQPALDEARRALAESIPQVALHKLGTVLDSPDLTDAQWAEATRLVAEAQRATGHRDDALATLDQLDDRNDPAVRLLRADILASALRWPEALALYTELAALPNAPVAAKVGQAESWQALGETARARAALESLVKAGQANVTVQLRLTGLYADAWQREKARALWAQIHPERTVDRRWARYLEGRILLLDGDTAGAVACFDELFQLVRTPGEIEDNLLVAATLALSEVRTVLYGWESADNPLETFISRRNESPWLELVFRRLDYIYSQERGPDEDQLQKWAVKLSPRPAALARYYLARMQARTRKTDKEIATLDTFVKLYPTHELLSKVQLMRADYFLAAGQFDQAVQALDAAARSAKTEDERAEIELHTGLAHFRQREFLLAAASLDRAGERSPLVHDVAQFDAALAWLNQGNYDRFFDEYRLLSVRAPDSELRGQLVLEEGLLQARQADARARGTLELFLRDFPRHERAPEARLALAELSLAARDTKSAARYFKAANDAPKSAITDDQADYFAIFLADAQPPRDDAKVVQHALDFLRQRSKSPLVPEVRMKLAQVYFRQSDFANAETQFGTLAHAAPDGPYAETALFLAGQAALKLSAIDRALAYFDEVAKRNGPLKLYARQQQAVVQAGLPDKESEAIALYDIILAAQPAADPELKYAAMIGKGDNLLALGRKDAKQIDAALAAFDQLAATPDVPMSWRNQGLYKKAKVLEQLNRSPEAISTFYDVLDRTARETASSQKPAEREYFWFYKAGFDAARIFEQHSDWRPAIGIYEKMAKLDGPRAEEARARTKQIRLEHFIWE